MTETALQDIATRLLQESGYVVAYYEADGPFPRTPCYLTRKGEAALEYAEAMDRLILEAYARVLVRLGEPMPNVGARLANGEMMSRAEIQPYLDSLCDKGLMVRTASEEYALTDAGVSVVLACDAQHPTSTRSFRVSDPMTLRQLAMARHAEDLARRELGE